MGLLATNKRLSMPRQCRFGLFNKFNRVGNPKETRSVSEGLFDFPNKPSTRYATNTSASRHPRKRYI